MLHKGLRLNHRKVKEHCVACNDVYVYDFIHPTGLVTRGICVGCGKERGGDVC